MTAIEETRKYLAENGFKIVDETLAKEDDKIYTVICAERGEMRIDKEINYYIGEALIKKQDKILPELLSGKIYEYEKAISSMKNSTSPEIKEKQEHFKFLISELKKLQEECQKW
jgi:tRNA (adenine22-N1)-methyltransferase